MKIIFPVLLSVTLLPAAAQVAINTNGAPPHASAMLEVTRKGAGVLIPRMTTARRDAIPAPATGLMVCITDDNLFHFFYGSAWIAISSSGGENPPDELQSLSRTGAKSPSSN